MKTVFGLDIDAWTALNAIAAIMSAIGTLVAVIVALYLARRDVRPRMSVCCSIMDTFGSVVRQSFFVITGTNEGSLPLTAKGVFWTYGWFKKRMFIGILPNNDFTDRLPKELTHSQQVKIFQPKSDFEEACKSIASQLPRTWIPKQLFKSIRCGIYTSTGEFSVRVDGSVRKHILDAYEAQKTNAKQ